MMNKRIRQLAQEAGMYVDLNGNPWPKWMSGEECEAAYKKFAELIVRECASELIRLKDAPFPYDPEFGAKLIRKHFGVEE